MRSYASWGHFIELNDENMKKLGVYDEWKALNEILDKHNVPFYAIGQEDISSYAEEPIVSQIYYHVITNFEKSFEAKTGLQILPENYFYLSDEDEGQETLEEGKDYLRFNQTDLYDISPNKSLLALKTLGVEPIFDSYTSCS